MDIEVLKQIDQIGLVLASNKINDSLLKSLRRKRKIKPRLIPFWERRVRDDNIVYQEIVDKFSAELEKTYNDIKDETEYILKVIHKLNQGISKTDVDLLANAKWIRSNTYYEPLILTDDRDIATCGHLISSFFGITLGVISLFEIIRRLELDGFINEDPITDYCNYYSIGTPIEKLDHNWSKLHLETKISTFLKKSKIACHPCPKGRKTTPLHRIIR